MSRARREACIAFVRRRDDQGRHAKAFNAFLAAPARVSSSVSRCIELCGNQISGVSQRHRRDTCSMAWRCGSSRRRADTVDSTGIGGCSTSVTARSEPQAAQGLRRASWARARRSTAWRRERGAAGSPGGVGPGGARGLSAHARPRRGRLRRRRRRPPGRRGSSEAPLPRGHVLLLRGVARMCLFFPSPYPLPSKIK